MRYFRSPLASFHYAQRNNHIAFRKARAAKAGKQELSPRMSSPGGWQPRAGNKCCVKGKPDYIRGSRLRGWLVPAAGRTLSHKVQEQHVILKNTLFLPNPQPHILNLMWKLNKELVLLVHSNSLNPMLDSHQKSIHLAHSNTSLLTQL